MASLSKIMFSDMCLNGFVLIDGDSENQVKECAIFQREGRLVESHPLQFSDTHRLNSQVFSAHKDKR